MRGGKRQRRAPELAISGLLLHRQESPYDSPPVLTEEVETSMYFGGLFFFIFIHPVRRECNWPCILLGVETKISE